MKNLNYIISGVLTVAVIVLFVLQFSNKNSLTTDSSGVQQAGGTTEGAILPLAYINVDSLLSAYNYAKDMQEALIRKQESARLSLNQKGRELEQDASVFQKNIENSAFLSRERAEQERSRLVKKQEELQRMSERLTAELSQEQQQMFLKLNENIMAFIREYNATKKYQVIFSNTTNDNILYADKIYDITEEVITELNKRYAPGSSGK